MYPSLTLTYPRPSACLATRRRPRSSKASMSLSSGIATGSLEGFFVVSIGHELFDVPAEGLRYADWAMFQPSYRKHRLEGHIIGHHAPVYRLATQVRRGDRAAGHDVGMAQHHPFAFAGGAGRVQDRREILADGPLATFLRNRHAQQIFQTMQRRQNLRCDFVSRQHDEFERRNLRKEGD